MSQTAAHSVRLSASGADWVTDRVLSHVRGTVVAMRRCTTCSMASVSRTRVHSTASGRAVRTAAPALGTVCKTAAMRSQGVPNWGSGAESNGETRSSQPSPTAAATGKARRVADLRSRPEETSRPLETCLGMLGQECVVAVEGQPRFTAAAAAAVAEAATAKEGA